MLRKQTPADGHPWRNEHRGWDEDLKKVHDSSLASLLAQFFISQWLLFYETRNQPLRNQLLFLVGYLDFPCQYLIQLTSVILTIQQPSRKVIPGPRAFSATLALSRKDVSLQCPKVTMNKRKALDMRWGRAPPLELELLTSIKLFLCLRLCVHHYMHCLI